MSATIRTQGSRNFQRNRILLTAVLGLYFLYTFIPIWYVITASTKTNQDLFNTFGLWFSDDFQLGQNLYDLFTIQDGIFGHWLWNTFFYATTSAIGSAILATLAGYAFAKYDFVGKKFFYALVLGAVMIPQTALVIPIFLMLSKFGILNTAWAVILPSLVFPTGVFLMRTYIDDAISNEIIDAGRVDGAGEFHIFSKLAFRMLMPGFTTVSDPRLRRQLEQLFLAPGGSEFTQYISSHSRIGELVRNSSRRHRWSSSVHRGDGRLAGINPPCHHRVPDHATLLAGRLGRRRSESMNAAHIISGD